MILEKFTERSELNQSGNYLSVALFKLVLIILLGAVMVYGINSQASRSAYFLFVLIWFFYTKDNVVGIATILPRRPDGGTRILLRQDGRDAARTWGAYYMPQFRRSRAIWRSSGREKPSARCPAPQKREAAAASLAGEATSAFR